VVRSQIPPLEHDRILTGDLEAARGLIVSGALRQAVEAVVGSLN
jgi:histidine ammonia-lyase